MDLANGFNGSDRIWKLQTQDIRNLQVSWVHMSQILMDPLSPQLGPWGPYGSG